MFRLSGPRRPLAAALLFIAGALAAPTASAQSAPQASIVSVDTVTIQARAQTVPVLGRLVSAQAGVVAARIGGAVAAFPTRVGDRVAQGDVLAHLAKDRLEYQLALRKAEVDQAEAALKTAEVLVSLREQELKRQEGLRKSAAFSQARFEDKTMELAQARSAAVEARAARQRARVTLRLAEIDLADADIRAPYGGVVSQRHTEVGAYINPGQPVVSLIDDEHLEIEAEVPANRVAGLVPGATLTVVLSDGTKGTATVRAAVPEENPQTRTRRVRFVAGDVIDTASRAANQTVTLSVPAGAVRDVLSVHKDAVLTRKGATVVYVVEDGKAQLRPVRLGEAVGRRFEVVDGLKDGDSVVVRGNERLRPGQAVRAEPAER